MADTGTLNEDIHWYNLLSYKKETEIEIGSPGRLRRGLWKGERGSW